MRTLLTSFLVILFFGKGTGHAQSANIEFVENKGQWNSRIIYKGTINSGAFFLEQKGFKVLQTNPGDLNALSDFYHGTKHHVEAKFRSIPTAKDKVVVRSHAYEVTFVDALTPVTTGDKPLETYNNYFIGKDPALWKGNCRIYQAVKYSGIYKGVDVRYYTHSGRLKYDIVVHPGGDISHLAMKYDGVDGLRIKDEQLVISTSVGEIRELAPYAYQVINNQKKVIGCRFKVSGNIVTFSLDSYLPSAPLVIDPTLVFATLTGSTADNWGYTATYDNLRNFYAGGIVFNTGFPVSNGAFQRTFAGGDDDEGGEGFDIGIIKFTPDGVGRVYATYIGGSGNEQPHSLIVDENQNLVLSGRTGSSNYPLKNGDTVGRCGGFDIIITKLNAAGTDLIGSRKIGGTGRDGTNIGPKNVDPEGEISIRRNYGDDARSEVLIAPNGNIMLASNSASADFPIIGQAFQQTIKGQQDGVFIMATPDLSNIVLSTFIGGSQNDAVFVLATDPTSGNIYLGGNTASSDLPGDKTGVLRSTFQGGETDGFVAILNPSGTQLMKTTYMGTDGHDMLYGIQFDRFGFPYIMGTTTGVWPVINAAFSEANSKQFIAKLKPDLSAFEYSTTFGTNSPIPNISPIAFLVDRCENVYVSGWGGSVNTGTGYKSAGTRGLNVTPDAIQSTTDNNDFYFFVLERNATRRLYSTFFGQNGGATGEHVDGGTSRFDRDGIIYQAMCANCRGGAVFPSTPGVWSPTNGSTNCNLAAVKISFNLAGISGSVRSSIAGVTGDTVGCVPLTVDFTDTIGAGKLYIWNFNDGTKKDTTTTPTHSHTFTQVGTYRVQLVSIDSSKCNIADTAYTSIRVRTFAATPDFTFRKLEPCDQFNYSFTNTSTVTPPARPFTENSFLWDFGDNSQPVQGGRTTIAHSFPGPGNYNVKLLITDTNFCNAPVDTVKVLRIATNVVAAFQTPPTGCAPYTAVFNNTSAGGQQFFWSFGDGSFSTLVSPTHEYSAPGTYTVSLIVTAPATCNLTDTATSAIVVSGSPLASYTFTPNPPQENQPVRFFNNSVGAVQFLWKFGDGDSLSTSSTDAIEHAYNETNNYNACLIAINNFGCTDTSCSIIPARVVPLLDVPNAFTPNGDGINDRIFVRGFAITRLYWRIYNRWGVLVYETTDKNQGWDGTYNGIKQPKEVYHYVLDAEFSDKTRYQKKGDITLLR